MRARSFASCLLVALVLVARAGEGTTVTVFFDNEGAESGITVPGATDFSFMGSEWSGGEVGQLSSPLFTASPPAAYGVIFSAPAAVVLFDIPLRMARFFFVGGTAQTPFGTATAFDASGTAVASVNALNVFLEEGDPFVVLDPAQPIAKIEFTSGFIDNFEFEVIPEPASPALLALALLGVSALARRR